MTKKYLLIISILILSIQITSVFAFSNSEKVIERCYKEDVEVVCPQRPQSEKLNFDFSTSDEWQRDILPENFMSNKRNNPLFISFFVLVLVSIAGLFFSGVKIFGKKLTEYINPIKYYLLGSFIVAASQYVILEINNFYMLLTTSQFSFIVRLSQALWGLFVALAIVKLVTKENFNLKQILFTAVFFNIAIMMTKVSIRYFLYGRSIFYVVDRLLYGTILILFLTLIVGGTCLLSKRKEKL